MSIKQLKEVKSVEELRNRPELHRSANELIGASIVILVLIILFSFFAIIGSTENREVITGSKTMSDGVVACGFFGAYDGYSHGVTVILSDEAEGAQVRFGERAGKCNKSELTYKDVGKYCIYYEVKKYGYKTVTGSCNIVITQCLLNDSDIVFTKSDKLSYDGDDISISYEVTANEMLLEEGTDYELSSNSDSEKQHSSGEYTLKICGKGNYAGYAEKSWSIVRGKLAEYKISDCRVEYDGEYHSAAVELPTDSTASVSYGLSEETATQAEPLSYKDIGVHKCVAKISQEGCEDAYATILVIIGEKDVIIYLDDAEKSEGEDDPELTYSVSGIVEGESLNGIILSRTQGEEIGNYDITARELQPGISNPNYNVGVVNAKLSVTGAGAEIKSDDNFLKGPVPVIISTVVTVLAVSIAVQLVISRVRKRRT